MKNTLSDIKQMFNVKDIAYNTSIDALPDGSLGIFQEDATTSIATGLTYATMPTKIKLVAKHNNKLYTSFNTIDKTKIYNQLAKAATTESVDIWSAVIENCNCINGIVLKINVDEQSLIQRDGLTWSHSDFVVTVAPAELTCLCSCDGSNKVYENNIMTKLLYDKIIAINSPFYTAEVTTEAGVAVPDLAVFIAANKTVNTDTNLTNDGAKLKLFIKGKVSSAVIYRDLEVNYVYPRGVKITPSLIVNTNVTVPFTKVASLVYEIGNGADMRAEEFETMSLSTNLNFYPRLSDGIQNPELLYQFENSKKYNTVSFEFTTPKSGLGSTFDGFTKSFGVVLGTTSATKYAELVALFVP